MLPDQFACQILTVFDFAAPHRKHGVQRPAWIRAAFGGANLEGPPPAAIGSLWRCRQIEPTVVSATEVVAAGASQLELATTAASAAPPPPLTLDAWFDEWLALVRPRVRRKTADYYTVSRLPGHSSMATTATIYAHVIPGNPKLGPSWRCWRVGQGRGMGREKGRIAPGVDLTESI